jgi:hypothetical protein
VLKALYRILERLLGGSIARALTGAGLGVVNFAAIAAAVTVALNLVVSKVSGMPADIANGLLIFGFGEAMSIIGASILTRVAMESAGIVIGRVGSGGSGS